MKQTFESSNLSPTNSPSKILAIEPFRAIVLLFCVWLVCYVLISALLVFVLNKMPDAAKAMRIGAVIQDLILFIAPAVVTAIMSTRLPATLLCIDRTPKLHSVVLAFAVLVVSIPAMNLVIHANNSMHLPESMANVEQWMREAENNAAESINIVLGGSDFGSLIISILIVGILAGLSEELLFRGALQRFLQAGLGNAHVAIWIAAFLFSAVHLQFYGFFPRMLLGAFFGYLLYWSGSLWLPVLAHMCNNIFYVVGRWGAIRQGINPNEVDGDIFSTELIAIAVVSVALTAIGLYLLQRSCANNRIANTSNKI